MNYLEAIIMGLIQGLCEFLPVSSSGHLVLTEKIFGIEAPGFLIETALHIGTLAAVVTVYWRDLLEMLKNPLGRDVRLLVVATVPTVIAALLLGDFLDTAFSGAFLGISFLLTTAILWIGSWMQAKRAEVAYKDAAVMGLFQVIALLPGVSRSGSTIAGGLFSGLERKSAARFAFLMSIPAILGSMVLELVKLVKDGMPAGVDVPPLLLGMVVAAAAGLFAIRFMIRVIEKRGLFWFGLYTLVLGIFVLIDQNVTHLLF